MARAADEEYNKLLQELEIAKAESKALQYGQTLAATRFRASEEARSPAKKVGKLSKTVQRLVCKRWNGDDNFESAESRTQPRWCAGGR